MSEWERSQVSRLSSQSLTHITSSQSLTHITSSQSLRRWLSWQRIARQLATRRTAQQLPKSQPMRRLAKQRRLPVQQPAQQHLKPQPMRRLPKRRITRTAYVAFLVTVLYFGFPSTAWAYIDPATTSYIIQIVSGLIISLSVALGVFASRLQMGVVVLRSRFEAFWLRMRNQRYRQLYARAKAAEKARRKAERKQAPREPLKEYLFADKRSLARRIGIAAVLTGGFVFSFIFFGILDILVVNREIMPYPIGTVFVSVIVFSLICFAVLFMVLALTRGRVFNFLASVLLAATLVFYVQGNFMNGSLGQLTGDALNLSTIVLDVAWNTLVCILLAAVPFVLWFRAPKVHEALLYCVPALLICMQGIALISTFSVTGALDDKVRQQVFLSNEALYEVAPQDNVIVILLDRLDQRYIDELLLRDPEYFEGHFDGFTRYTNNISTNCRTFPAVVNLLTGYEYNFDKPAGEYMREAWTGSDFLPALREQGMRVDLYTEYSYVYLDGNDLHAAADNLDRGMPEVDDAAVGNLAKIVAYRYVPYALKPLFQISTDVVADDVIYEGQHNDRYVANDHAFYNNLTQGGLSINTSLAGNFKFIHLNGCHPPFNTDANLNEVPREQSNQYYQTRFAFATVFAYLDELKRLGLYDDATIIITGDHGYTVNLDYQGDFYDLSEPELTGLFVKKSGAGATPLAESALPVSSDNFRAFVWKQVGLDYQDRWGFDYEDMRLVSALPRRTFMFQVGLSASQNKYLQYFEVIGDASDFSNWHQTQKVPMQYYHGYTGG